MANYIKHFQTISRHEQALRQPPTVILCLTKVLNYIKEVLDDDSTQTLFEMIGHHITTKDVSAHYLNVDLLSNEILEALRYAFVSIGVYNNERAQLDQMVDFFRDIYDGTYRDDGVKVLTLPTALYNDSIIPTNYDTFAQWLISNPKFYVDSIPVDPDAFRVGLTLRLVKEWFRLNHDVVVDAHLDALSGKLGKLFAVSDVQPSYWLTPDGFANLPYVLIEAADYNAYMQLVQNRLTQLGGNQTIIDFNTYADTAMLPLLISYEEATLMMSSFFEDIYAEDTGVKILQFNIEYMKFLNAGGAITFEGFPELCEDCGETTVQLIGRKFVDYYKNHLTYVLSDSMTPEYKATLTAIRNSAMLNYTKVFSVASILGKNNFAIAVNLCINHLTPERTIDFINVVGLSKSIACLSLVPYHDGNGTLFNRLVVSFDNYNPDFTVTILDGISTVNLDFLACVITMRRDNMAVYLNKGDDVETFTFNNVNRLFDVDPFFLFTGPRIDNYKPGTTRINSLKLYGKAISDADASAILAGFQNT